MITAIKPNGMLAETDPQSALNILSPHEVYDASIAINSVLQQIFCWADHLYKLAFRKYDIERREAMK